jgi:hypothetical protein
LLSMCSLLLLLGRRFISILLQDSTHLWYGNSILFLILILLILKWVCGIVMRSVIVAFWFMILFLWPFTFLCFFRLVCWIVNSVHSLVAMKLSLCLMRGLFVACYALSQVNCFFNLLLSPFYLKSSYVKTLNCIGVGNFYAKKEKLQILKIQTSLSSYHFSEEWPCETSLIWRIFDFLDDSGNIHPLSRHIELHVE